MVRVRIKLERLIRGGSIGKGWVLHRRGDMVSGVWNADTDVQVANTTAATPGRAGDTLILNCQFITIICFLLTVAYAEGDLIYGNCLGVSYTRLMALGAPYLRVSR